MSNIGFDGSGQGGISYKFTHNLKNYNSNKINLSPNTKINYKFNRKLLNHFKKNNFFIYLKYYVPNIIKSFVKKKLIKY